MPGVVTNSRSKPSSLKKPLSRATSTGRSCTAFMVATWGLVLSLTVMMRSPIWTVTLPRSAARWAVADDPSTSAGLSTAQAASAAIPADSLFHRERILQPGVGKVAGDHLRQRLEQLELVALFRDPEHDYRFQGRTSGKAASDLRDGDRRLFRELEALSRPLLHALDRLETSRNLLGQTQHR